MERLDVLRQCGILDTPPEPAFDDITNLAASLCDAPMAAVTLIDSERQWLKSAVGLESGESSRETAFCAHTILEPGMTIVSDAQTDTRFADNPLVTGTPHIRFYAGAPLITSDGYALGALCIIDSAPRQLTPEQETTLRILSRQITAHLELRRYTRTQRRMLDERRCLGNSTRVRSSFRIMRSPWR